MRYRTGELPLQLEVKRCGDEVAWEGVDAAAHRDCPFGV
jgi:hypothetical protein